MSRRAMFNIPIITDWITFVPTGPWSTNSTWTGRYRRVGDSMEVMAKVALAGAPDAVQFGVDLPAGFTMETDKLPSTDQSVSLCTCVMLESGVRNFIGIVSHNSATRVKVNHSESSNAGSVNQAAPFTFGASDEVHVRFVVPIVGWKANA